MLNMQLWKQNIYFTLEKNLENIKKQKKENEDNENTSIYKEKELEILDIEEKELRGKLKYLEISSYFNKEESFDILSYAVSQIEGKKYSWREQNICFWYLYNGFPTKEECTMAYLVEEGLEEIAQLEIQSKFPFETKETSEEQKLQSAQNYRELSTTPSDSYIQLAFYEKDSSPNIRYRDLDLNGPLNPFGGICSDRTNSNICDKNYSYLPALMDRIEQYKIGKILRPYVLLETTEKEIYHLIDKFVAEYKDNQSKGSENPKKVK